MTNSIRILMVDDHAIVREGLRALIETEPDLELAGEAVNGQEAIKKADELQPDVILMDLVMPHMDGVQAIQSIRKENQEAQILILSSFTDDEKVIAAIQAGAQGFVLKDSEPEDLLQAIRDVYNGESPMDPIISRKLLRQFRTSQEKDPIKNPLTERETEVLILLAQGLSTSKIAVELFISERTVGTHVSNILNKLHLENRTQAALYALRQGFIEL